jgi:orotate phosphoribosyltransferase-like protein
MVFSSFKVGLKIFHVDFGIIQIIDINSYISSGIFAAGEPCLIIEDVITTGSSILETVTILEEAGLFTFSSLNFATLCYCI